MQRNRIPEDFRKGLTVEARPVAGSARVVLQGCRSCVVAGASFRCCLARAGAEEAEIVGLISSARTVAHTESAMRRQRIFRSCHRGRNYLSSAFQASILFDRPELLIGDLPANGGIPEFADGAVIWEENSCRVRPHVALDRNLGTIISAIRCMQTGRPACYFFGPR